MGSRCPPASMRGGSHESLRARPATAPSSASPSTEPPAGPHGRRSRQLSTHLFCTASRGCLLLSVPCMVMCTYCEQEMTEAASCVVSALHVDGVEFPTVPYGK